MVQASSFFGSGGQTLFDVLGCLFVFCCCCFVLFCFFCFCFFVFVFLFLSRQLNTLSLSLCAGKSRAGQIESSTQRALHDE